MKKIFSTLVIGFILISCTDYKANPKSELNQQEIEQIKWVWIQLL